MKVLAEAIGPLPGCGVYGGRIAAGPHGVLRIRRIWVTFRDSTTLTTVGNPIQRDRGLHGPVGSRRVDATPSHSRPTAARSSLRRPTVSSPGGISGAARRRRALEIAEGYHALALSPDGRTAAVGIDGGIQLVDVRSGRGASSRGILAGEPEWLLFSPDGETVVSTGLDGTVTLWDVESATPRATLRGHSASVGQPVFSPDGATLYTASDDGTAIAWDVDGNRRLGRPFTFTHDRAPDHRRPAPGEVQPGRPADRRRPQGEGHPALGCDRADPGGRAAAGDRRRGQRRSRSVRTGERSRPSPATARRRSGTWSRDRSGKGRSMSTTAGRRRRASARTGRCSPRPAPAA